MEDRFQQWKIEWKMGEPYDPYIAYEKIHMGKSIMVTIVKNN